MQGILVSLLVRLWVEMKSQFHMCRSIQSASLWGCELKYDLLGIQSFSHLRQPPCEAVSWNTFAGSAVTFDQSQPPCEAVSWNITTITERWNLQRQPPCEAVSWNLKMKKMYNHDDVSLLVRLWVEISDWAKFSGLSRSASLWGCELKCIFDAIRSWVSRQPPCEAVSWNIFRNSSCPSSTSVSLLVRLWVEIPTLSPVPVRSARQPPCEAVSWNIGEDCNITNGLGQPPCEAVSWNVVNLFQCFVVFRQPPCEAVSWNLHSFSGCIAFRVSLLVRLWVEMQYLSASSPAWSGSASLWGCELKCCNADSENWRHESASLWGCELKYLQQYVPAAYCRQPPCEAVSWNTLKANQKEENLVSLLVRLWVEISLAFVQCFKQSSASLWGCELK